MSNTYLDQRADNILVRLYRLARPGYSGGSAADVGRHMPPPCVGLKRA
jgi:hypothetical protein